MKYSDSQIWTLGRSMKSGLHGSFAAHIGEALMVADIGNRETLIKAFDSLFDSVARFNDIEPTFDEAKQKAFIERKKAFIERRMSILDKKLYQGHISQDDYESMVNDLKDAVKYLEEVTA
tara:strand:+ start:231 stop:590 length:360 start_codon:yes stop_codon:yes gene_type:complete